MKKKSCFIGMLATCVVLSGSMSTSAQSFKPFISNDTIKQTELNDRCVTDSSGLRTYGGRYVVSSRKRVGTYLDLVLSNNRTIPCVVGAETNEPVIGFVVSTDKLPDSVQSVGDISAMHPFSADIIGVRTLDNNDEAVMLFNKTVVSQDRKLVTDKYRVNVAGKSLYFLRYMDSGCMCTKAVTPDVYKRVIVNYTTVDV